MASTWLRRSPKASSLMPSATFEAAKRLYPKDLIEYRKGAQLLDRSGAGEG
jgi:hypothetical protein